MKFHRWPLRNILKPSHVKASKLPLKQTLFTLILFSALSLQLGFRFWHRSPEVLVDTHWIEIQNQEAFESYIRLVDAEPSQNHLFAPLPNIRARALKRETPLYANSDLLLDAQTTALNTLKQSLLKNRDHQVRIEYQELLLKNKRVPPGVNLKKLKKQYDVDLRKIKFDNPKQIKKTQKWFLKKTHGVLLPNLNSLDPKEDYVRASEFYFKGNWRDKFEMAQTKPGSFETAEGSREVLTMHKKGYHGYLDEDRFQALDLRYGDGKLSLLVFLPKEGTSLEDFYLELNPKNWKEWGDSFLEQPGEVQIPRFRLQETVSPYEEAGFEINENGSENDFQYDMTEVLGTQNSFKMAINRPFFFAVVDNQTDLILLMGQVTNPQN